MNVSFNKYIVPTGLHSDFCFALYQYVLPNGTVPAGLNIGRIKSISRGISPVGTKYYLPGMSITRSLL